MLFSEMMPFSDSVDNSQNKTQNPLVQVYYVSLKTFNCRMNCTFIYGINLAFIVIK